MWDAWSSCSILSNKNYFRHIFKSISILHHLETRRFNLPLLEKRISAMNPRVLDSNAWILGFKNKTFGFGDTNTYAHTQNATADRSSHRGGT